MMKTLNMVAFGAVLVLTACNKKKDATPAQPELKSTPVARGLPAASRAINGYFYASMTISAYSNTNYYYSNNYAVFNDPASDLMSTYDHTNNTFAFNSNNGFTGGNVSVGNISLNNTVIFPNQSFAGNNSGIVLYNSSNTQYNSFDYSAHWTSVGNKSFKPINTVVPDGYPVLTTTLSSNNLTLSISNGFTVVPSNYITNYDSVVVRLSGSSSFSTVRKAGTKSTGSFVFTTAELQSAIGSGYYGTLYIYAYNYSNQMVENKTYVFELSTKLQSNIYAYP